MNPSMAIDDTFSGEELCIQRPTQIISDDEPFNLVASERNNESLMPLFVWTLHEVAA